jgi:dolichyl-phosphate-mannose--protein O-mannosyl transferase
MNLDTFILIVVPVVAWLLIKRFLRSLLVSWLIGVPFLWLNMARHETRAPAFESPLIFVLAMGYWATLLIAFNAMVVTTAWALR